MIWKTFTLQNNSFHFQKSLKQLVIFLLSLSLVLGIGQIKLNRLKSFGLQSVQAQNLRPEQAAEIIYQELPSLPKENQYLRKETGAAAADHTLISRFIRYHQDIRRRPTSFSLDWRITLADYLGVNQFIRANNYPGATTLNTNPLDQDIKAISQLNRQQRQALVDLLVTLYTPKVENAAPQLPATPTPEVTQPQPPSSPNLSQPGDAQLLMP